MAENDQKEKVLAILDPLIYGDIFDFPLTIEEIHRFCPAAIKQEEIKKLLQDQPSLRQLISRTGEYYHLSDREQIVRLRQERQQYSRDGWKRAAKMVNLIQYVPFLKGILVTGSLAVDNARHDDDLDFLVLTSPERLWFVFAFLGTLQRIISRRNLCPNYYLSIEHLHLRRKNRYIAREALQAQMVYGLECVQEFYRENNWVKSYFPNSNGIKGLPQNLFKERKVNHFISALRNTCEWMFGGHFGDIVEQLLRRILKKRLFVHYGLHGQKVPEDVLSCALKEIELRFHGLGHEENISRDYQDRLERILSVLGP